nr:hypothetical protein [Tanacetum cinerariifolium]
MKIDPHHFNAESDLIESLLNRYSLIIYSSSKIDSLFDEFVGKLTLLKSIPPGINETDCDPEEETRLIKRLFDYFIEEIDLSFTPDDLMPPGIEEDDYDSERDILILEELLCNDSLSLPENESFHFDIPSSSRPPAKPPDDNLGILNVKVMGDISEHNISIPRFMFTQPTLVPNQEKSPNLLSHQGHEAFQPSAECPMMIYRRNILILDDSDSFIEEIDLSFTPDDLMPPGIEEDDYDSERDILILEELLGNDSLSLPENESFRFDIPSSSRPPAKPPDDNLGILN